MAPHDQGKHKTEDDTHLTQKPSFGIIFDIDGVLLRGKTPIPSAKDAIRSLMDEKNQDFVIPTVFCTNGFGLPEVKAATLTEKLGVPVNPDQIVMSQTPLQMFHELHDKWCLISGPEHDGGAVAVAKSLGFNKIITIDQVRKAYPYLDWVDRNRWPEMQLEDDEEFPEIEAIVMMGEPIRWETNLQLIIDIMVTQGKPNRTPDTNAPQIPVLAVNMDLLWMAKATTPRFGHGAFLVCLESLYKKITGKDLQYTALIGKPSEITYEFSQKVIEEIASTRNIPTLETIYAIGDNPLTDIYGANMYNKFQAKKKEQMEKRQKDRNVFIRSESVESASSSGSSQCSPTEADYNVHGDILNVQKCTRCSSLLVCTGVYQPTPEESKSAAQLSDPDAPVLDHGHRDLPYTKEMTTADYVVHDVKAALDKIFEIENWQAA